MCLCYVAGDDPEELHERPFWKAMGSNPPLYGADTPQSLFDEELEFGWNLKKLGCLLQQHGVKDIPGVTTPMTYFGMWRVCLPKAALVLPHSSFLSGPVCVSADTTNLLCGTLTASQGSAELVMDDV